MSTEATVIIKGRNDLSYAVKSAERDLRQLARTGELIGKLFRGGAIVGAALAFERLAENAQKASEQIGDKGTAEALRKLNREIDLLKMKGTNLIGKVLGNVFSAFSDDKLLQLREQVDFLRRMQGRSFLAAGYKDIGTGFFTAAEGAAKLLELEKKLDLYEKNRPFGSRTRAPGSHGGGMALVGMAPEATGPKGRTPETPAYIFRLIEQDAARAEAYYKGIEEQQQLSRTITQSIERDLEAVADAQEASIERMMGNTERMTVFQDQAARDMQSSFAAFLFDPFEDGVDGMVKGFVDAIRQMVAAAAAAKFFEFLGGVLPGGLGKFFAGARASGGPVMAGRGYLVGERGPEMFVPGTSGAIVPNGAGGVSIVNYINAPGADAERIMAILPPLLRQSSDQTVARVQDLQRRGRL